MSVKHTLVTRRNFLKLAGASVATGVVAACGGAATPAPQATSAPQTSNTEATAAPTTQPAAGSAELIYYYGARATFKDLSLVQDEMNKILKDKIGATIQLNPIDWSSFSDKMQLKNAAGEKYDMAFTSNWANPYYPNVKNGVLLDLTDILPNGAPNYWKTINPGAWDAAKVGGKLYAAINQQTWTYNFGVHAPKQYTDKYKLDLDKVSKFEDLEPYWDAVLKGEAADVKAIGCNDTGQGSIWAAYYESTNPGFGLYNMKNKDDKVTYNWDNPGWVAAEQAVSKWNKAGYYGKEPWPAADFAAKERGAKEASTFHNEKPGGTAELKAIDGFDWVAKILSKNYLETNSLIATMIGINKKSTVADACIKYLELVNTDKPFYNLLCYGIEGKHWVWKDKAKEVTGLPDGVTADNSGYNPNADWEYGNQFMAYYSDPTKVGDWEATAKLNNEATPSPILGFSFDQEPVKTEMAQITAIGKEYTLMDLGFIDYTAKSAEYQKRTKDAGGDKVLAEINKQLDAWRSSK